MWDVDTVRLTAFAPDTTALNLAPWTALTGGGVPTQTARRPNEHLNQDLGPYRNATLVINVAPNRADIFLAPAVGQAQSASPPTLGAIDDALKEIEELATRWLVAKAPIQRLALGVVMGRAAANANAALAIVLGFIPSFSKTTPLSDFYVQINRPRVSKVDQNMRVNRLSKWSVVEMQLVQMQTQPGSAVMAATGVQITQHRAILELDVNTPAQLTTIDGPKVLPLVGEFVQLALEIAQKGDVP